MILTYKKVFSAITSLDNNEVDHYFAMHNIEKEKCSTANNYHVIVEHLQEQYGQIPVSVLENEFPDRIKRISFLDYCKKVSSVEDSGMKAVIENKEYIVLCAGKVEVILFKTIDNTVA